jgi:asparagine synthase (glutamine-hydrolysing)
MCGIAGVYAFSEEGKKFFPKLSSCVKALGKRGPDSSGIFTENKASLAHTRLSIIDTSSAGNQPFTDFSGRYTIIFNGEFFNYQEHRKALLDKGIPLKSDSDTEVLLYLFIQEGPACLEKVNGFFAFSVYDKEQDSMFIARDRMGIKPLFYALNNDRLIFASEMKALLEAGIEKEIDSVSLAQYFSLNYIPAPNTIFKAVKKLEPGHYIEIKNNECSIKPYYQIPLSKVYNAHQTYDTACKELFNLMDDSVQKRLISDVPLGTFLSGGIDSSVVTALAARHTKHLQSFSIGFKDEPLFDETHYARLTAKKLQTEHTVFSLTNRDLFDHLYDVLDYIDEPFADSSALNVFILSKETRKHVTVALSGDGADEIFAGYHKHMAEYKARKNGAFENIIKNTGFIWNALPKSRNGRFSNIFRKLAKFSEGLNLNEKERYFHWASLMNEEQVEQLLLKGYDKKSFSRRKSEILNEIKPGGDYNEVLLTDAKLVLPNDMLVKVDLMSMANSLEVRVPFLDYRIVDFAFSLPAEYKIDGRMKKRIVQDAFREILPTELYNRPKQGFEVPLLKWFRTELSSLIHDDLLSRKFIEQQGVFQYSQVEVILKKLKSADPGDAVANVWALIVFQYWWKKYLA